MKCKGFLFDLDGTLVDSLPVVERSWINWAKRQGINPQQVLAFIHGKQAITSLRHFMPDADAARLQEEFEWLEELESRDTEGGRCHAWRRRVDRYTAGIATPLGDRHLRIGAGRLCAL